MFIARKRDDVLFLEMNSLKSTVNVMTRQAAQELHQILDQHSLSEIKLIVLISKKKYSFLNGAELLLTNHINRPEDLEKLSRITASAYERLANLPVPTLAAIEGNCFGCGMEFSLCCDYRVASDSYDTYFYMTELVDYHCLPIFGGLWRLPRLVGLKPSVDLLLGGEKWWTKQAKKFGLVDEVFRSENFFQDLERYFHTLLEQGPLKRSLPKVAKLCAPEIECPSLYYEKTLKQIHSLPPIRQPLYHQCLDILSASLSEKSFKAFLSDTTQHWQALNTELTKKAGAFFFMRNMAKVVSVGTSSTIPNEPVTLALNPKLPCAFGEILRIRKLAGLKIYNLDGMEAQQVKQKNIPLYLEDLKEKKRYPIQVLWGKSEGLAFAEDPVLYFPFKEDSPLCEVFIAEDKLPLFRSFLVLLPHLGWEVIVVPSAGVEQVSPINRMLEAFFHYADLYLSMRGRIQDLNFTLWLFGFEWSLHEMIQRYQNKLSPLWRAPFRQGQEDPRFLEGLFSSLYQEGLALVREGWLKHSSQVELIMRLVLGYPLVREQFMKLARKKVQSKNEEGSICLKKKLSL